MSPTRHDSIGLWILMTLKRGAGGCLRLGSAYVSVLAASHISLIDMTIRQACARW